MADAWPHRSSRYPIRFDIRLKRFPLNCQWVKTPVGEEVTQPDVLTISDECLGKVRNQVKKEKPISFRFCRVKFSTNDSGWYIVHHDQTVENFRIILGEARCDTGAAIMPH